MFGDKPEEELDPVKKRRDDLKRKALLMARKKQRRAGGATFSDTKSESSDFSDTTSMYSDTSSVMSEPQPFITATKEPRRPRAEKPLRPSSARRQDTSTIEV